MPSASGLPGHCPVSNWWPSSDSSESGRLIGKQSKYILEAERRNSFIAWSQSCEVLTTDCRLWFGVSPTKGHLSVIGSCQPFVSKSLKALYSQIFIPCANTYTKHPNHSRFLFFSVTWINCGLYICLPSYSLLGSPQASFVAPLWNLCSLSSASLNSRDQKGNPAWLTNAIHSLLCFCFLNSCWTLLTEHLKHWLKVAAIVFLKVNLHCTHSYSLRIQEVPGFKHWVWHRPFGQS